MANTPDRSRTNRTPFANMADQLYPQNITPEDQDSAMQSNPSPNGNDTSPIDFTNLEGGFVNDSRVVKHQINNIEHAPMGTVSAITLHQTNSPSAQSTLNGWQTRKEGAHFLIGEDGTIYQVASLNNQTWHVGQLQARCVNQKACSEYEAQYYRELDDKYRDQKNPNWAARANEIYAHEREKDFPDRYPFNSESIGIELVGEPDAKGVYPEPNAAQAASLKQLVAGLKQSFGIENKNIFKHGQTGTRYPSECAKCNP